nr:transposase [Mesorhizobium sp. M00.F.Ca.ET.216.01.1.1]
MHTPGKRSNQRPDPVRPEGPTPIQGPDCEPIDMKLLKIGAQVRVSVRRIKVAMASACPYAEEFALAHARIRAAAR